MQYLFYFEFYFFNISNNFIHIHTSLIFHTFYKLIKFLLELFNVPKRQTFKTNIKWFIVLRCRLAAVPTPPSGASKHGLWPDFYTPVRTLKTQFTLRVEFLTW